MNKRAQGATLAAAPFETKFTFTDESVLSYQRTVEAARQKISDIRVLMDREQKSIDDADSLIRSASDMLDGLKVIREDVLADIALGKASESDLERIDQKINEARKAVEVEEKEQADAQSKAATARAALSGLSRKLAEAEEDFNSLVAQKEEVVFRYLLGIAENAAKEYISLAARLTESFNMLIAVNSLMERQGNILGRDVKLFSIPTFNLPCFDGLADRHYPGQLAGSKDALTRHGIEAATAALKKQISEAGVIL